MGDPRHGYTDDKDPAWPRLIKRLGKDIRSLRQGQGHSIQNLTQMMGQQSGTSLSQIENGTRLGVSLYTVFKTARALGYDMEITFVKRASRAKKEQKNADQAGTRGDELSGGDPDRNVVELRPVQPHPSRHAGHR